MADFIEKKGLGQDVDASQVNLSANDLARLGRIQGLDARSGYSGLGIQQAQELTSELPQAADLGLVVEQNKQLAAAGGRGYEGNVHNLQGDQTPFEQLTASIAASQVPDQGGVPQEQIELRGNGNDGNGGDGNGGDGGVGGRDLGTLGHFGQEAFSDVVGATGVKGLTSAGLAYGIGAPLGLAAKFGISSMFNPLGALLGMGRMAYGGALDMSHDQAANAEGIDVGNLDMNNMDKVTQQGFHPAFMGYDQEFDYQSIQEEMERATLFDRLSMAVDAAITGPEGGWTKSTNIDKELGVHKGTLSNDTMGMMAGIRGLSSSFGDPFGIGLGGSDNDGSGGFGGGMGGGRAGNDAGMSGENDAGGLGGGGAGMGQW